MDHNACTRRSILKTTAGTAAALAAGLPACAAEAQAGQSKGRIRQSVSRWCYKGISLPDLCKAARGMGIVGVDLLGEKDWATVRENGLICTMAEGPTSLPVGWNRTDLHDKFVAGAEQMLPKIKEAGLPNMIVFSGNRGGISDADGIRNCVKGLKRIMPLAEQLGVTVCMELLNSKVDHKDYQCDHTAWGVEVVKGVGSDRFRLLYDIYHMQIMEGDIIRTIRDNIQYIGHFHTGGVPGRHELDATQELNYKPIMEAIAATDFKGYVAHEFVPARDPLTSLREAVETCDV